MNESRADYIRSIIDDLSVSGFTWAVKQSEGDDCIVWAKALFKGKKLQASDWVIPVNANKSQILAIIFNAVTEIVMSQIREVFFLYKGLPVFSLDRKHRHLLRDS